MNSPQVHLVSVRDGAAPPAWPLGPSRAGSVEVERLHELQEQILLEGGDAVLFWDPALGRPDFELVRRLLERPGDIWHAGLKLGMAGMPGAVDFVDPTRLINCDPDPLQESSSWRLSLRACLIRLEALRELGGLDPEFQTIAGAGLELGHRMIARGALVRYLPALLEARAVETPELTVEDEWRFLHKCFGLRWARWALWRAALSGYARRRELAAIGLRMKEWSRRSKTAVREHRMDSNARETGDSRVTVLIPTVERYPYLRTLLEQLGEQTVPPYEIIIVDQTPRGERDEELASDFARLPLKIIQLDSAGQCRSRNAGLKAARGDLILFLDDDDEVPADLIESHLKNLAVFDADVSSGVAEEVGAGPVPEEFSFTRVSDVFPTNNTMVRRRVLERAGLFDLAYDRGARADGDLGMRVHLSGALMMLRSEIRVLHHHAPRGGLRLHKARVITRASSRRRLTHFHLPSATEIYLAKRYFSARQVREALWISLFGTFAYQRGGLKRLLRLPFALLMLPGSYARIRANRREAERMLTAFPQIPAFGD